VGSPAAGSKLKKRAQPTAIPSVQSQFSSAFDIPRHGFSNQTDLGPWTAHRATLVITIERVEEGSAFARGKEL
jgi:hypothetical protein